MSEAKPLYSLEMTEWDSLTESYYWRQFSTDYNPLFLKRIVQNTETLWRITIESTDRVVWFGPIKPWEVK